MASPVDFVPEETRSWLYGVALAVGPLLVAAGKVSENEWALWIGVIVAVLGLGTATAYRPTGPRSK